jgi:hypothetical protein
MSEWTDRLASALTVPPIDQGTQTRLLDASRDIAHRVERKDTPISTFMLGVAVGTALAAGTPVTEAIEEAFEVLARTLADEPPPDAG